MEVGRLYPVLSQQAQTLRQFFVALLAAVWIHVGLIFIFVLLLVFEVLAAKEISGDAPEEKKKEKFSELVLSFEEDTIVDLQDASPETETKEEPPPKEPDLKFARTRDDQVSTPPVNAEFIGDKDTKATSDAAAVAGDKKAVALSGKEKKRPDNNTFDSQFSDGDTEGPKQSKKESPVSDLGEDQKSEDSIAQPKKEMKAAQDLVSEEKQEEFVDIEGVIKTIEDAMAKDEQKPEVEVKEQPEIKVVKKKKATSRDGGFNSQTSKTKVKGVLSARGIGALNVENSAVGAYGSNVFRNIEREWQMGNIRYRSLIAPGHITLYFVIDKKGRVSRQNRLEMRGASGTQWGIVLNSVTAAKIPPMPEKVIEELGGEDLELTMSFTYN